MKSGARLLDFRIRARRDWLPQTNERRSGKARANTLRNYYGTTEIPSAILGQVFRWQRDFLRAPTIFLASHRWSAKYFADGLRLCRMPARVQLFYDADWELCRASVSWLRSWDRRGRIEHIPATEASVRKAGLDIEACRQRLHIVTRAGVFAGWRAVCYLARMFPSTWLIGALGALPPFRWAGDFLYDRVARNRYGFGKCSGDWCRLS